MVLVRVVDLDLNAFASVPKVSAMDLSGASTCVMLSAVHFLK